MVMSYHSTFSDELLKAMPELNDYIPLHRIPVQCAECNEVHTGEDVNNDRIRFHKTNGATIRFPSYGLKQEEIAELEKKVLLCELCWEEQEEM